MFYFGQSFLDTWNSFAALLLFQTQEPKLTMVIFPADFCFVSLISLDKSSHFAQEFDISLERMSLNEEDISSIQVFAYHGKLFLLLLFTASRRFYCWDTKERYWIIEAFQIYISRFTDIRIIQIAIFSSIQLEVIKTFCPLGTYFDLGVLSILSSKSKTRGIVKNS